MNYSMFYNFHHLGDILLISFENKNVTDHERKGQIEVLYHNEEIIGYNIFDISKIMKIKVDGLIILPPNALIDAINSLLSHQGLAKLPYVSKSNFVVGEVIDSKLDQTKYLVDVKIDGKMITVISKESIQKGLKVVVAIIGATLFDNSRIDVSLRNGVKIEGHLCTKKDINMEDSDELIIVDDDAIVGADFFTQEVK